MSRSHVLALVAVAAVALTSVGCQKKQAEEVPTPAAQEAPAVAPTPPAPVKEVTEPFPAQPKAEVQPAEPTVDEINRSGVLKTVYLEYDSSDLSEETRAVLQQNATWLKGNRKRAVRVGGHCDERGAIEYNIALGDRRANSVRDYLVSLGVDPSQLRAVSFGEEQPIDPGHGEEAWRKNRRAEFTVES